jgi:clan AA aspartic protease
VRDPFDGLLARNRESVAHISPPSAVMEADEQTREEIAMGATHVTVTIRNPAEPHRTWEALFLVDTGATDCLVPRPGLEAIGLVPRGQRVYELADGREIKVDITVAEIEFMGEIAGGTVIFGEADAEPLLGVTALESVGIEVDPTTQRLKRLPAVRLKSLQTRSSLEKGEQHGRTTATLRQGGVRSSWSGNLQDVTEGREYSASAKPVSAN